MLLEIGIKTLITILLFQLLLFIDVIHGIQELLLNYSILKPAFFFIFNFVSL